MNRIKRRKYQLGNVVVEVAPEATASDPVTRSLGRNLVKAIVKPTVSHIAEAYNELEVKHEDHTFVFFLVN
jgi:hypothetical protein